MKAIFINLLFTLLFCGISCNSNSEKQNTETITKSIETSRDTISNSIKINKDTFIVKSLNDCIKYYNIHNFYPDNFINGLKLSNIEIPYHRLMYLDKINENLFFVVYSYSIENEEGRIELITCDSQEVVLKNLVIQQIYSEIYFKKVDNNIFRIYGNNTDENGISENRKTNESNYAFDFNATIKNKNEIIIGSENPTNEFTSLLNEYKNGKKPELSIEERFFGVIKEKEYVTAYYNNKLILFADNFVIVKVLKVIEEGGFESSLTLNSYTLKGELISKTDAIVYTNDEWSGSEVEIELDKKSTNIHIIETETKYKIVEEENGTQKVEKDKDYLKVRKYDFHYDNTGKINRLKTP